MRNLTLLLLGAFFSAGLFIETAQAQLFSRKKSPEPTPESLSTSTPSVDNPIFRQGKPDQVAAVDYTLENGERVDRRKVPKFFNRKKSDQTAPVSVESPATEDLPTFEPPSVTPPTAPTRKIKFPTLPSLRKNRTPQVPISTETTEVLTADTGSEPALEVVRSNPKTAKPPRKEGDTIIYSSWDDVQSDKTSAAARIVRDLRNQEAAHERKKAAAQKAMEAELKKVEAKMKAQEEARRRAMLLQQQQRGFGGGVPGGIPRGF